MNMIWTIAKKELSTFFDSLIGYIMIVIFLLLCGFLTWFLQDNNVFAIGQADLSIFFSFGAYWSLFILIPALTMKLIAEEKRAGTIEMLLTKPISDWQVVLGKFLATLGLVIVALILTLPYYFTVWKLGPVDHGAVWSGYLALILMSAAYIAIGVFTSSITDNQIVSLLLSFALIIVFHLILGIIASGMSGTIGEVFDYLSVRSHFDSMSRGVIDSKDVIYFVSIILIGLLSAEMVLAKRNISD